MSEEAGTEGQEGQQPEGGKSGFTPPASQEEFNQIIERRLERERAKFGDYDDLQAKAAKLDEIEEANKTEQQKLADRLAEEQKAREMAQAEAMRFKVASKFGVSEEDAELFLTGSDEETLTKQAERLSERDDQRKKRAPHVPREGATTPDPKSDPKRAFLRELTGKD